MDFNKVGGFLPSNGRLHGTLWYIFSHQKSMYMYV